MMRKFLGLLMVGWIAAFGTGALAAFPERNVRIIVPYVPGGVNDVVARIMAQELTALWGKNVIVDNRPGGSGTIGAKLGATAAPDGYTLLLAPSTFAAHPALYPRSGYDLRNDLAPIVQMVAFPVMIISAPNLKMDARQLVEYVKASREPVNFATGGNASTPHMAAEWLRYRAGGLTNMTHIPYKGDSEAIQAVLSGTVPVAFSSFLAAMPFVKKGTVNAVAVTSAERNDQLPNVPTVAEGGLAGYEIGAWASLMAPAGTPSATINTIAEAVQSILARPDMKKKLNDLGLTITPRGPEQLKAHVDSEIRKFTELIQAAKITAD